METKVGALVCAIALAGCGDNVPALDYPAKPGQGDAVDLVWSGVYGMTVPPPSVVWVEGAGLNCAGEISYRLDDGRCVFGDFRGDLFRARVAWPAASKGFSDVALAHELCHAAEFVWTGDLDAGHAGRCFVGDRLAGSGQIVLAGH